MEDFEQEGLIAREAAALYVAGGLYGGDSGRYWKVLQILKAADAPQEMEVIQMMRQTLKNGLARNSFERLKEALEVSNEELCRIVNIPMRTLARRERFMPDESERIVRVARVFQRAVEVMGNVVGGRRWFKTPKPALGGCTPLEFCDTEPGAMEVENLLGRLEHGVFT